MSNYAKTTSTIHHQMAVLVHYNNDIMECKSRANGFYCLQISDNSLLNRDIQKFKVNTGKGLPVKCICQTGSFINSLALLVLDSINEEITFGEPIHFTVRRSYEIPNTRYEILIVRLRPNYTFSLLKHKFFAKPRLAEYNEAKPCAVPEGGPILRSAAPTATPKGCGEWGGA